MDKIQNGFLIKFTSLSQAFRFFDKNYRLKISFTDFVNALEQMQVYMSANDAYAVFSHYDSLNRGYLTWDEFTILYDQEMRVLDPGGPDRLGQF